MEILTGESITVLTHLIVYGKLKRKQTKSAEFSEQTRCVVPDVSETLTLLPSFLSPPPSLQAGAQISLADVSCSEEKCTKWYNLLSRAYMPEISSKDKESRAAGSTDRVRRPGLNSLVR